MKRFFITVMLGLAALNFHTCPSSARADGFEVVYSFQGDGYYPSNAPIYLNGILYGTTEYGGTGTCEDDDGDGCGMVYSLDPATGVEEDIFSFQDNATDGAHPDAPVFRLGARLYGTTLSGQDGTENGTIFQIRLANGAEKSVFTFDANADGCHPDGALVDVKGTLYGTTDDCGETGGGALFGFTPKTGTETTLYIFCSGSPPCADGKEPTGELIFDGKRFYGTTIEGGSNNGGVVFSVDARTHKESVIHNFCSDQSCGDGDAPYGGLTFVNGLWYGTTSEGGAHNMGVVYSIDLSTGAFKGVHSFTGGSGDGDFPETGLTRVGNKLYGTTLRGGGTGCSGPGCGTVFSFDTRKGKETLVYGFCSGSSLCPDGSLPNGKLLYAKGMLYGVTGTGGTGGCYFFYPGCGTVYAIKP